MLRPATAHVKVPSSSEILATSSTTNCPVKPVAPKITKSYGLESAIFVGQNFAAVCSKCSLLHSKQRTEARIHSHCVRVEHKQRLVNEAASRRTRQMRLNTQSQRYIRSNLIIVINESKKSAERTPHC